MRKKKLVRTFPSKYYVGVAHRDLPLEKAANPCMDSSQKPNFNVSFTIEQLDRWARQEFENIEKA